MAASATLFQNVWDQALSTPINYVSGGTPSAQAYSYGGETLVISTTARDTLTVPTFTGETPVVWTVAFDVAE